MHGPTDSLFVSLFAFVVFCFKMLKCVRLCVWASEHLSHDSLVC